ncbi:MAG: Gfo/Idh/MocA family oxidoreductase, partial [Anaerolineae bacterium]
LAQPSGGRGRAARGVAGALNSTRERMDESTVRIALVGCGYWGPNLARNLSQVNGGRLMVCTDTDAQALARMERQYPQVEMTTDSAAVLQRSDIDAVVLATPARTHAGLALEALAAGKHVFVEKPLALSVADAEQMVAAAQAGSRVLMVGHVFEYHPALRHIKQLLDKGELGDLYYLYSTRVNLGRVQADINALWSIAPHDIAIMLHLVGGLPLRVSAHGQAFLSGSVEDVVFVNLEFAGGVIGHIHASWLDPSKTRQLTVVGSRRMVVYDDVASEGKVKIYDKGVYRKNEPGYGEFQVKVHSGDITIPRLDMTEPLQLECQHYVDCIREGRTPLTDGVNGLQVVRVLAAAQASLAAGGLSVAVA